jgi:hypothetical protein
MNWVLNGLYLNKTNNNVINGIQNHHCQPRRIARNYIKTISKSKRQNQKHSIKKVQKLPADQPVSNNCRQSLISSLLCASTSFAQLQERIQAPSKDLNDKCKLITNHPCRLIWGRMIRNFSCSINQGHLLEGRWK